VEAEDGQKREAAAEEALKIGTMERGARDTSS